MRCRFRNTRALQLAEGMPELLRIHGDQPVPGGVGLWRLAERNDGDEGLAFGRREETQADAGSQ